MKYNCVVESDVGIVKPINQDSCLLKKAIIQNKNVVLAIICDGVGGLQKGELASASVVRVFSNWFDHNFTSINFSEIEQQWKIVLNEIHTKIHTYGKKHCISLGTTFTGILFIEHEYLFMHVGDTRLYFIDEKMHQLTMDHSVSPHVLLQCMGASKHISPQIKKGIVQNGFYLLCSDGFYHVLDSNEIIQSIHFNQNNMKKCVTDLIHLAKKRKETDNISVILIKCEDK